MHGNKFSIDNDNTLPCANGYEYDGTPMAIQAAQLQINEIVYFSDQRHAPSHRAHRAP